MLRILRRSLSLLLALSCWSAIAEAAAPLEPTAAAKTLPAASADYLQKVKPLLTARCYACHGALKQEAGLRLDTAAAIRTGGDSGPAIVPGDDGKSVLIARLTTSHLEERMPPEGEGAAFKPEEVALLRSWIAGGAAGPALEKPEADPRDHWSFRAPVRPPVPRVKNMAEVRNPIDAFLAAEQERRGVVPQPPAERGLLLRRVYLDLVGLPPTGEQLEAFLDDKSPDAYERVVERLLASPQYGERWGRHWMDVWRYSDWWGLGAEVRNSQKHIRHWRDWIIESLNADLGYDEMIRQMLAADELYPEDMQKIRATGFLVRSYFKFNRTTWLEQVVEHTSKGFLGLTLNCAKCHDHKYDPLPQKDFYRLRAFFEPYQVRTDELPGEADLERDGLPRVFDCHLEAATYRFVRGDESKPIKDDPIAPALPAIVTLDAPKIVPITLSRTAHEPGSRSWVVENHLRAAEAKIVAAKKAAEDKSPATKAAVVAAEAELIALRARIAADRERVTSTGEKFKKLAEAAATAERRAAVATAGILLAQSEVELVKARDTIAANEKKVAAEDAKKDPVLVDPAVKATAKKTAEKTIAAAEKKITEARAAQKTAEAAVAKVDVNYMPLAGSLKAFESSTETDVERRKPYPATSTGRRTALARMLTDKANPLVARVAVNHIWLRHMGKPLVPTIFDFGRKGTPPTNPELLDWLALELMDGPRDSKSGSSGSAWSMKHVHRLIVTSNAYRRSSSTADNPGAAERDSENVSYWRMNTIRIEAQAVRDALLQLSGELDLTSGGPTIDPKGAEFSMRRSLYFTHSHNEHHRFLSTFDDADVLDCYRREQSIVPQQALALANAQQSLKAAEKIAANLAKSPRVKTDDEFILAAFRLILASQPSGDEVAACRAALAEWRALPLANKADDASLRARVNLVHALLNHNDFVTVR
ncbi:MAG: DUF1549 domain-containing protein [Planctomycetia bacterium]|nr:DUF1549 domain-containing protein [Planctomycetia bacterium]